MHVCFSRSAIDAGTESVSHGLAQASEKPSIFFKTAVTAALNKQAKEVSSELKSQRLSQRREAGGGQAKRWHWRRGNEVTHTPTLSKTTHLARFLPFRLRVALCRNGQKRPKLRTGPHATTGGTNLDVHALGRFRVPSRPTARRVECLRLGISGRRS